MYVKNKENKLPFSKNYFWNTNRNSAECQTVWIQIRTDVLIFGFICMYVKIQKKKWLFQKYF